MNCRYEFVNQDGKLEDSDTDCKSAPAGGWPGQVQRSKGFISRACAGSTMLQRYWCFVDFWSDINFHAFVAT